VTQANVTATCVNTKAERFMIEIDWNCGCEVKSFSAVIRSTRQNQSIHTLSVTWRDVQGPIESVRPSPRNV
jgi:hypothetical protein